MKSQSSDFSVSFTCMILPWNKHVSINPAQAFTRKRKTTPQDSLFLDHTCKLFQQQIDPKSFQFHC